MSLRSLAAPVLAGLIACSPKPPELQFQPSEFASVAALCQRLLDMGAEPISWGWDNGSTRTSGYIIVGKLEGTTKNEVTCGYAVEGRDEWPSKRFDDFKEAIKRTGNPLNNVEIVKGNFIFMDNLPIGPKYGWTPLGQVDVTVKDSKDNDFNQDKNSPEFLQNQRIYAEEVKKLLDSLDLEVTKPW